MKNIEEVIQQFRQHGFKITPQRRAVFKALSSNDTHPSVETVYQEIKTEMPDISLATIYNTLNELNSLGLIDIVRDATRKAVRYDTKTEDHDHLYCLKCSRIIDIPVSQQHVDLPEDKSLGFQIVRQQVTYFGYCPDCRNSLEE